MRPNVQRQAVLLLLFSLCSFIGSTVARLPRVLPLVEEGVIVRGDCEFLVNGDLIDPAPLFARYDSYELIVPDPTDTVRVANGELLDMFCTDGFAAPFENRTRVTAQCLQQKYFLVDGLIYPFSNFSCNSWSNYTARRTGRPCNGGTDLVEVGFELDDGGFLQTYDVCHDEVAEATRYVHHVLHPSSYDYQHGVARPNFLELDFFGGKDVNSRYTQVQQNITISEILGQDASPYFNYTEDRILARGHLIAKTDQIFGTTQMSTFLYINVAPQWQCFNGGNWERVETSVRKFVADSNLTVDCYTGTWGISTLPDATGVPRELYLDFDENNNGLIPVPRIYFRVVIDRESRNGIVLIGVNNPYASLEEIEADYIVCEDIGHKLSWVTWYKEDLHEGYSYACTVEDFTAVVKDLPLEDLDTNGILGIDDDDQTTSSELPSSTETSSSTTEPSSSTDSSTESTVASTESSTASETTTESTVSTTESSSTTESTVSSTSTTVLTTEPTESTTASSSSSTATSPPTTTVPSPYQCRININGDLNDPAPLLTPEGVIEWLQPLDESGIYILELGESIELHCTSPLAVPLNRYTAVSATCLGNQTYQAEGYEMSFQGFSCQSWPTYIATRTGQTCPGGTELVQIGFDVAAGFLPQFELCYDELNQTTRYVQYELTPANVAYQLGISQPGYLRADFYAGKDVSVYYTQAHQESIFSETLELDASFYFDSLYDLYLTRGQLAPRHDFVHGSAQRATHFYVNAAPQWRSISIGNWLSIETSVRQFVAANGLNVSIHAGSWGVDTLPNALGVETPLYLAYNEEGEPLFPVPRIFYRIVIDQTTRAGIALVTVNNPFATLSELLANYVICEDVGARLDWMGWQKTNAHSGYAYACDVQQFIAVVQDLPVDELHTTGLLGLSDEPKQSCSFRINGDLTDPAPLYVQRDEQNTARWVDPNVDGIVELQSGEQLELHCPKGFSSPFQEYQQLNVTCYEQFGFETLGSVYNLSDFVCNAWPAYTARRTGRTCNGGTDLAEVGFELTSAEDFLQIFDVCHDELAEATRYVHHVLTPGSAQYQRSVTRPSFITGDFYDGKDVNTMYTQVQQQLTVDTILGEGANSSQYFNISSDLYMARGHLAAKTDFVFGAPQKATFFFINAAPQWQCFNGGNWERVEDSVRKFVADSHLTVDCYTGTWGISTLPDATGAPRELYLNFDENNNGLIPVPRLYFRIIIDRASRYGIVLIGVNNPHASLLEIQADYVICEDISDELDWVSWSKTDLYKGYSYACTVDDFTAVVKDLPLEDLQVNGVLGTNRTALHRS